MIAGGAACYLTLYMYEKAMWTNAAKEKTFKKQVFAAFRYSGKTKDVNSNNR
jgi:fzo-like conserved region.